MSEYKGEPIHVEQARHMGEARQQRRKLTKRKAVVAAAAIGVATLMGVGANAERSHAESDIAVPDAYYSGIVEIVKNPHLNVRETPMVINNDDQQPNVVRWDSISEVNGVDVKDRDSFRIKNPVITEGDDPMTHAEKGTWITLEATIDQPMIGPKKETVYINFGAATNEYVKTVESGSFMKLDENNKDNNLGEVDTPLK